MIDLERIRRRLEWVRLHDRHNSTVMALADDVDSLLAALEASK